MKHLFTIRQIALQIIILIISNIAVTCITLSIIYYQNISVHKNNLIDIAERQHTLITVLHEQGHTPVEIIQALKRIHSIGQEGEFTIGYAQNDSIRFLLAEGRNPDLKNNASNQRAVPMRMALSGKSGFVKGLDYKGETVYAAYTYFAPFKWGIVAKIPTAEINHPYYVVAALSIVISIVLVIIWVVVFSKVSNPLIEKIINSEEHYRSLFEKNHACMLVINPNTLKIIDANQAACKYYGFKRDQITLLAYTDINTLSANEISAIFQMTKKGVNTNHYFKHRLANGEIRDVEVSRGIIRVNGEELVYAIVYDVTQKFQTERKLKESEETYRTLFSSINDAVLVSTMAPDGRAGKLIEVNDIACKRLGYTREELLTMTPHDLHSPSSKAVGMEVIAKLKEYGQAIFEIEHVAKNGKVIPVEISTRVTQFKDKTIIHSISRDITDRKLMEQKLQRSLNIMSNTQTLAKIGGWEWNIEDNTMYWTDETYRIHEIERSDLANGVQEHIAASQECYSPEDRETVMAAFTRCLQTGEPYDLEFPFTTVKGKRLWIRTAGQAEWHNGKIAKIIGNISDISQQKANEMLLKEKTQEIEAQNEEYRQINHELLIAKARAEENDRLKTAFLQNMSHEIRTPMNAIMGFSELLPQRFNDKLKIEKFTKIINQRCRDLLDLINEILDIAKIESGQLPVYPEEFKLQELFVELQNFFVEHQEKLNKQHIKFSINLDETAKHMAITTDKVKLKQIFINLIGNAFKFTELGQITAGCRCNDQGKLEFYVSDTGIGIPKEKHQFVFERFTQLNHPNKQLYGGTGLGLSIVKGLVNLLEGQIHVDSEPNKGSTFSFTIYYETAAYETPSPSTFPESGDYQFKGRTVLIVEDDVYNSEYLSEILASMGFTIYRTEYGNDALELATSNNIDIVLMDIGLPDINGYEATSNILKRKPAQKIIAQTAFAAVSDRQKAMESGCVDYLSKPINRNDLADTLSKHLKN